MINSSASGKVRAQTAEDRSKARMSKANKSRIAALRGAAGGTQSVLGRGGADGTASSLAFTPVQGIELVDPSRRKAQENEKWFKQGQFSLLPGAKSSLPGSMPPPPKPSK
jgi:U4/U6 small nuclear ribonucleoprotein PRP31